MSSPERTPRGRLTLYAGAFGLMILAGALVAIATRDFLKNTTLLWISAGLSLAGIALAILAVTLPRRR
jgi:hypothetical protein